MNTHAGAVGEGTGGGGIVRAGARAGTAIVPRVGVTVRAGTLGDVAFLDRLQKLHSRELGFLPTMALEGKVRLGQVLVAEVGGRAAGYLIAADRYQKRDEVGYVTQIAVASEHRRSLVAGALLQAQFDRSAYGCRLYCCWCAQDLKANEFWEAMGFTPIAFRTGSRTKGRDASGKAKPRIHLFWQKRVRPDDDGDPARGGTPWWYPAQTGGGELREDRLVFPIPPGVGWRDVLPVVLPEEANAMVNGATGNGAATAALPAAPPRRRTAAKPPVGPARGMTLRFGGSSAKAKPAAPDRAAVRPATADRKIDPRLTAMARELRDRWTEQVTQGRLRSATTAGKYALVRSPATPPAALPVVLALPDASAVAA